MAAYDDSSWMQTLESLGLTEVDCNDARILLAGKDSGFRQGMLGSTAAECNKRVILKALSESSLNVIHGWGCLEIKEVYAPHVTDYSACRPHAESTCSTPPNTPSRPTNNKQHACLGLSSSSSRVMHVLGCLELKGVRGGNPLVQYRYDRSACSIHSQPHL